VPPVIVTLFLLCLVAVVVWRGWRAGAAMFRQSISPTINVIMAKLDTEA
jgi:hypothetical protein